MVGCHIPFSVASTAQLDRLVLPTLPPQVSQVGTSTKLLLQFAEDMVDTTTPTTGLFEFTRAGIALEADLFFWASPRNLEIYFTDILPE